MNTSIQQESQFNLSKAYSEEDLVSDLDPMLEGGTFKVAFYRQCPFEIRETDSEGKQFGIRNILNVRIMANPAMEPYLEIKLQITSEVDLYLVYECKLNQKKFERLKKLQNLNFNYANLLPMLIKLFGLCDKFPQQYSTLLYMSKTGAHRLTIIQNIEYKSIELLTLEFESVDQQLKKQCLSFRFSLLKSKNERIEVKTREMLALVKLKNPNLLQSIAKKGNTTAMGTTLLLSRMNRTTTR